MHTVDFCEANCTSDARRVFRPFFLDPKTSEPTSYKIYYDIFSYVITQTAFNFTTAPFILLTLPASFLVWGRLYFYGVIGVALSTAFFMSPGKVYLTKALKKRSGAVDKLERFVSQETLAGEDPVLGLPPNPSKDFEEAVKEVKAEMEARQRKGIKRASTVK